MPLSFATVEAHATVACVQHKRRQKKPFSRSNDWANAPVAIPVATNVLQFPRRGISAWWFVPSMAAALQMGMLWPRTQSQHDVATLAMVNGHFSTRSLPAPARGQRFCTHATARGTIVIVAGTGRYDVYGVAGNNRVSLH